MLCVNFGHHIVPLVEKSKSMIRNWCKMLCVKFGHNILTQVLRKANLWGIDAKCCAWNSDTTFYHWYLEKLIYEELHAECCAWNSDTTFYHMYLEKPIYEELMQNVVREIRTQHSNTGTRKANLWGICTTYVVREIRTPPHCTTGREKQIYEELMQKSDITFYHWYSGKPICLGIDAKCGAWNSDTTFYHMYLEKPIYEELIVQNVVHEIQTPPSSKANLWEIYLEISVK